MEGKGSTVMRLKGPESKSESKSTVTRKSGSSSLKWGMGNGKCRMKRRIDEKEESKEK